MPTMNAFLPIKDDGLFLIARIRHLHVINSKTINFRWVSVEEDFHLKWCAWRNIKILRDEISTLSNAHTKHWLRCFSFYLCWDVEIPKAIVKCEEEEEKWKNKNFLLGFPETSWQDVSAGNRMSCFISCCSRADWLCYALYAHYLLLVSAFHNNFMIKRFLLLSTEHKIERETRQAGKKERKKQQGVFCG